MATSPIATTPPDQTSQPIAVAPDTKSETRPILKYPENIDGQDFIVFSIFESIKEPPQKEILQISKPSYNQVPSTPYVILPIQPTISDQNTVNWGSGELNELQRRLVNVSLNAMGTGQIGEAAENLIKGAMGSLKDLKALGQLYLAEQAVGVQGLLSRTTGQVLNPNLELLFQGPQLRPFNFTFKLSPRTNKEADIVKKIIRFFKKYMSVRKVSGDLFLKSPYVFSISYVNDRVEIHPSLNLIKICALQSFSVDYTPLGSYMTYDDQDRTMVSYNLNLQFQEIEPIYDEDYNPNPRFKRPAGSPSIHPIGY